MTTQFIQEGPRTRQEEHEGRTHEPFRTRVKAAGAGAVAESMGAAAAIVLAIIGLTGALTTAMMAIATIVLGGAMLMEAGAIGARFAHVAEGAGGTGAAHAELAGGISAEGLAGAAGVVLGILALLGLYPVILCAAALIGFGGALLLGSVARARFASVTVGGYRYGTEGGATFERTAQASAGGEVLVGIGAIVLGILALLGLTPVSLVLVGFLGVGFAMLMSGSALGARMFSVMHHHHV